MNNFKMDKIKEKFSREYRVVYDGKQTAQAKVVQDLCINGAFI